MGKYTLVLGASEKAERYSNLAMRKLKQYGHPVAAIGRREGEVDGIPFSREKKPFEDIDTVTLYLNAKHQESYYDYILSLRPKRIIFNPGAENKELADLARANHIDTIEACTLVMLGTGQY